MTLDARIARAVALLREGEIVAVPTETVYGLAADATNDRAVARIFEAKGRPSFNPLIVHVADAEMAKRYVEMPPLAEALAQAFWPGPLTLALRRKSNCGISLLASAGLDTLAVRAPDNQVAQALISAFGKPLAAPSANLSGSISPTRADHVRESLGERVKFILDGGPCAIGIESTIVKVDGEALTLLRPGGLAREAIERVAGRPLTRSGSQAIEAPGMMQSHYAPRVALRLNALTPSAAEAFLAFGPVKGFPHALNLSAAGDLIEAAANLFGHLRALDAICAKKKLSGIAAAPVPATGIGEAINDRLSRAAAPR